MQFFGRYFIFYLANKQVLTFSKIMGRSQKALCSHSRNFVPPKRRPGGPPLATATVSNPLIFERPIRLERVMKDENDDEDDVGVDWWIPREGLQFPNGWTWAKGIFKTRRRSGTVPSVVEGKPETMNYAIVQIKNLHLGQQLPFTYVIDERKNVLCLLLDQRFVDKFGQHLRTNTVIVIANILVVKDKPHIPVATLCEDNLVGLCVPAWNGLIHKVILRKLKKK